MISYKLKKTVTQVFVDGKLSGTIKTVAGGYQYYPKGSKSAGDIYRTMKELKDVLEEE